MGRKCPLNLDPCLLDETVAVWHTFSGVKLVVPYRQFKGGGSERNKCHFKKGKIKWVLPLEMIRRKEVFAL